MFVSLQERHVKEQAGPLAGKTLEIEEAVADLLELLPIELLVAIVQRLPLTSRVRLFRSCSQSWVKGTVSRICKDCSNEQAVCQ